jgi:hypothetical protein
VKPWARAIGMGRSRAIADLTTELAATLLRRFGECRIRVCGTSMLPSIKPADSLLVRTVDIERIAVGDVVLFAREGRLFAHRVVQTHAEVRVLLTRGDAHTHLDPPVTAAMILGRVEALLRNGQTIRLAPAGNTSTARTFLSH